jgi:hypothetical protein
LLVAVVVEPEIHPVPLGLVEDLVVLMLEQVLVKMEHIKLGITVWKIADLVVVVLLEGDLHLTILEVLVVPVSFSSHILPN